MTALLWADLLSKESYQMSIKLSISEVINGNSPKSPTVTVEEEKKY
jgi:hypothetical protein